MWKHSDDNEGSCKGLRVKYHLGTTAAGSLLPTVLIYSGFNDTEMPKEDFYVCGIPGMTVNAHLDIRNQDMGYVCFMRKGVKQIRFFDWYEKTLLFLLSLLHAKDMKVLVMLVNPRLGLKVMLYIGLTVIFHICSNWLSQAR